MHGSLSVVAVGPLARPCPCLSFSVVDEWATTLGHRARLSLCSPREGPARMPTLLHEAIAAFPLPNSLPGMSPRTTTRRMNARRMLGQSSKISWLQWEEWTRNTLPDFCCSVLFSINLLTRLMNRTGRDEAASVTPASPWAGPSLIIISRRCKEKAARGSRRCLQKV